MQFLKRILSVSFLLLFLFSIAHAQQKRGSATFVNSIESENNKGFKTLLDKPSNVYDTAFFELNSETKLYIKNYINKRENEFQKMEKWGKPYFLLYDEILTSKGLPVELKYLSVIESSLNATELSDKGALGPWQLMPEVARQYGLKLNEQVDERTNFKKSTYAACSLLKDLYKQYHDWLLVIAAYNAGSGRINSAIKRAGTRDFWNLQYALPEETRNHVKRYIAAHYFFEGRGGITTLTAKDLHNREKLIAIAKLKVQADTTIELSSMEIVGKYNSLAVAKHLNMEIDQFNKLNPFFDKYLSEGKYYTLRLPSEKLQQFTEQKLQILKESVDLFFSVSANNKD